MKKSLASRFAPCRLRCEYEANPLGLGEKEPRLSWWLSDPATPRGAAQTAYQILVASSEKLLAADRGDLWDSGRVKSDQSVFVPYGGPKLKSRQRCHWQVRFWNAAGQASAWSEPAWWEMGLLADADWSAKWIGSPQAGGKEVGVPAPYLRKSFTLKAQPVSARLYITALGLYEASLNGKRVGDLVFTPGWTEYSRRVMVQAYDVTGLLKPGANALGAILGDGWYCGHVGPMRRQLYGDRPLLLAQLELQYRNGSRQTVATDGSWKLATGPIVADDMLMGETYDARLEMPGWNTARFDDAAWQPAAVFPKVKANLNANLGPRIRAIETIAAQAVTSPRPGTWIFDFGQNLVGWVRLRLRGTRGETLTLRHAEMLNPDGTIYTANLREAKATDSYTFADQRPIVWEPRFTCHGFRYLELTGRRGVTWDPAGKSLKDQPPLACATAVVLHSSTPPTGEFACSHQLINQLQHNIRWGQKGNFVEVPTDCPQRNERLGWTGDIQVFLGTACFNFDVNGFMAKWLVDLADGQLPNGAYPTIAPRVFPSGMHGTAGWADAGIICPWLVYRHYGDRRVLERHYGAMAKFMDYMCKEAGPRHLRTARGFGDWLSIGAYTPTDLIATAYFAHDADLMGRIAAVLGKKADAARYRRLFEKIRTAFQREFVTAGGQVIGNSQTAYVLALRFNLLPDALRPTVVKRLVDDIDHGHSTDWPYPERHGQISTGFIGCKHINHALTEGGRTDVAYRLLVNEDYPSWLFPIKNGATTIWERWDGWTPDKGFQTPGMNSFNHYAFGAVGEWMYRYVAGLGLDDAEPAFKRLVIRPLPGGGLTQARGALDTPYGRAACAWQKEGKSLTVDVTIPPNTTATIHLPAKSAQAVTESSQPLDQAKGICEIRTADGTVSCQAASGTYNFSISRLSN